MPPKKVNNLYYFSVEGQTEQWYLEWLQKTINSDPSIPQTVTFNIQIQPDPSQRVKSLNILATSRRRDLYHLSDYESNDPEHHKKFITTMDKMSEANKSGKSVRFVFGYSNFTFDLWMILHKIDCNTPYSNRKQYLSPINSAFQEHFQSMAQFKEENNFKRCLKKLCLSDVIDAIRRSKEIMQRNEANGYILCQYKGFEYYRENPSLEIGFIIEKILKTIGALAK